MHPTLNHAANPARIAELHRVAQQRRDAAVAGAGHRSRLVAALVRALRGRPTPARRPAAVGDHHPVTSSSG